MTFGRNECVESKAMSEHDLPNPPNAKKSWVSPELREQTVKESTASKNQADTESSVGAGPLS